MTAPNVAAVAARIEETCRRVGRDPKAVRLLGVTKQVTTDTVKLAVASGITMVGENRVQEARDKAAEGAYSSVTLCLIGHLQSNKASLAARLFDEVHSVDSGSLARTLGTAARIYKEKPLPVLMEVNAGEDPRKFGALPDVAPGLAKEILDAGLVLRGLMTVAPAPSTEETARRAFQRLARLREEMIASGIPEENLRELSMGMSGDFIWAIEEGSTMVRIGTAIFGPRQ